MLSCVESDCVSSSESVDSLLSFDAMRSIIAVSSFSDKTNPEFIFYQNVDPTASSVLRVPMSFIAEKIQGCCDFLSIRFALILLHKIVAESLNFAH